MKFKLVKAEQEVTALEQNVRRRMDSWIRTWRDDLGLTESSSLVAR